MIVRQVMNERPRVLINDRQMRLRMSQDLCTQTKGAALLGDSCPECRFFLFYAKGLTFCEFCRLEREFAMDSRSILSVAKLALQGIYVDPLAAHLRIVDPSEETVYASEYVL